jgi:hypothetical protein
VNEDNFKIKVSGFSRMLEGDKKNQIVEAINDLCQTLGAKNNVCSQIEPADFFQYNSDPLTYRVYRISLNKEPVPCQLIPFSIMLKFQININEDGIINVVREINNEDKITRQYYG